MKRYENEIPTIGENRRQVPSPEDQKIMYFNTLAEIWEKHAALSKNANDPSSAVLSYTKSAKYVEKVAEMIEKRIEQIK